MRLLALTVVSLALMWAVAAHATPAMAANDAPASPAPATAMLQDAEVDDNDDTRVEVQLVVLAIVVGGVLVVGTAAYLLRLRLGLVAPPPEQDAGGHH